MLYIFEITLMKRHITLYGYELFLFVNDTCLNRVLGLIGIFMNIKKKSDSKA